MRITQLRDLIAIVDSGSNRAAARSLNITQPVLTRSVRELEAELGMQLLERTVHGVVPTATGEAFLIRARTVQSELNRMREETAQRAGSAGTVTFGVSASAQPILPGALQAFRRKLPGTDIRIFGGIHVVLLPLLREGQLEFAIGNVPPSEMDKRIKASPLFRSDIVLVGRRGHPLRKAKSLEELREATYVEFASPFGISPDGPIRPVGELFNKMAVEVPRTVVRCNDASALLNLVAETDFIGSLGRQRLAQSPWRESLQAFDIRLDVPPIVVYLYHRADVPMTPAGTAMIAAVKAEAKKIAFSGSRK